MKRHWAATCLGAAVNPVIGLAIIGNVTGFLILFVNKDSQVGYLSIVVGFALWVLACLTSGIDFCCKALEKLTEDR